MVPKPVKAVILLFPITEKLDAIKKEEDEGLESGKPGPVDPNVIWIKQTVRHEQSHTTRSRSDAHHKISNACGTIGLLHALMNVRGLSGVRGLLYANGVLSRMSQSPQRARLLNSSISLKVKHEALFLSTMLIV